MKTKLTALLLATVAALTLVPKPAQAGDKELALIGGFIGGLIVGSALDDRHAPYAHDPVVISHDYDRDYGRDYYRNDRPRGHWEYRKVRVWVPACWEVRYDYGRRVKVYVPGYYEIRHERVWVAHKHRHGPRHW